MSAEVALRQDRQWSKHASRYEELFLDPFRPGVVNPLLDILDAIPDPANKSVIDLGCGTGPLLPKLLGRFGSVTALDFAPMMVTRARERLAEDAEKVEFLVRPMHDLADRTGRYDVAVAVNSLVMPDVREIDRTLRAIAGSLKPGGVFAGIVPAMDAIHYHTMLLYDRALDEGLSPEDAERQAAFHGEHNLYEFGFGRFVFRGLRQKFWQPFEVTHRLKKAGFRRVKLKPVEYPWDDNFIGYQDFAGTPSSWDWCFAART